VKTCELTKHVELKKIGMDTDMHFGITKLHTGTIHQAIWLHRSWEKGEEKIVRTFNVI
jgi:hypothetical protein